ncbi:hypothetical protein DRO41_00755 [Candidatus Bathyarchaeota archaeon]|nr:MAG: hypothetical protein DRO41_00755 [Candidatus Bathyarchaeota archaeon]
MLLQSKILSPGGVCIAHQPRISLRRMCDRDHLGALGVEEKDILPLEPGADEVDSSWTWVCVCVICEEDKIEEV